MNTFLVLVLLAVIIAMQIYLSCMESKWFGLILPVISFLLTLLVALNLPASEESLATWIVQLIFVLGIVNIPTYILIGIYNSCRNYKKLHPKN